MDFSSSSPFRSAPPWDLPADNHSSLAARWANGSMAKAVLKRKDTLAKKKEANQAAMKQQANLAPRASVDEGSVVGQSPTPTETSTAGTHTPAPSSRVGPYTDLPVDSGDRV